MIFVTVGTHTQSFNRLLEEVDRLVASGVIKEKVVAQIGNSSYEPKNMEWFRFTGFKELHRFHSKARIFITHGGVGSILDGLVNGKPVIAVPRLKKYNEHVNDHQLDIVKKLENKKKIIAVYDVKKLRYALSKVRKNKKIRTENMIVGNIDTYLMGMRTGKAEKLKIRVKTKGCRLK
jgi:UDP-N-acetylglucosamine transferase subunit ALG13